MKNGENNSPTRPENAKYNVVPLQSGAKSGALGAGLAPNDPDLAAIVAAWPTVTERVRKRVVKLAKGVPP